MPYAPIHGGQLHYAIAGDASKPMLILSNSLGTSFEMWAPQMAPFLRAFQVLRYDTRGHGQSSVTPGPYSIALLAGDVVDLMDHLGVGKAHFCGLSMGGITGMYLAIHRPERLHRLILANTAAYIGPPDNWTSRIAAVEANGIAPLAQAVVSRWLTARYAAQHPSTVTALEDMLRATPSAGYAAACAAVRDSDLREQVHQITLPALVIAGSDDLPTPPDDGKFLQREIAGARYVELAAAHLSNQEQDVAFAAAVTDFLG